MRNLKGVFSNNENKIIPYCVYYDLQINAVIGLDGKLQICDNDKEGERCAMFYLSEDKIYKGVIVQSMKMSEFIEMAKEQKADFIDLCNTTQCMVSRYKIESVEKYKKVVVDDYLEKHREKTDMFIFLDEKGLLVNCDTDENTITETTMIRVVNNRVDYALGEVLKKADVESFDELFRLVEIGKGQSIKN